MVIIQIFELFGSVLLRDEGVESKLDKIDKKGQSTSKGMGLSFGNMASAALKFAAVIGAGLGFTSLIKGAVEGASSLEGYRNTLNVVMKDTKLAGETFAWAVDFANKTPFETDSIVQATVRLTSYGLKAREVMPAIGDMAGVMNKDIMSAVEAVADAQTGELERMKEFGITKQMIIDQGNKIMKGTELVNKKGQIVDQENFNKAMFSLMDEKFKGGMELQANSFKGLWSTVTGVFKTSLAMMMGISSEGEVVIGGMFDTIKSKIKIVADTLTKWSTDGTMEKISKVFQSAFDIIGNVLKVAYDFIKDNIIPIFVKLYDWIKPNIPAIKDFIKSAFDIIGDVFRAVGDFIVNTLLPAFVSFWNWIKPYIPQIKEFVLNAFNAIKDVFKVVNDFIVDNVLPIFGKMKDWFFANFPKIKDAVMKAYDYIKPSFDNLVKVIKESVMPIIMGLWDTFKKAMPGIQAIFEIVFPILVLAVETVIDIIAVVIKAVKGIYDFIKPSLDDIAELFSIVFGGIKKVIEGVQWVLDKFNGTPAKDKNSTVTTNYVETGRGGSSGGFGSSRGYASGTDYATPGEHWVGEFGPEIVNFRGGETVTNAKDSVRAVGGVTVNIEFSGTLVGSNGMKEFAKMVSTEIARTTGLAMGGAW